MLLLLFLSVFTGIHAGCPIRCNCTDNAVNCISRKLEYIPFFEGLDNNPLIIDLSGNSIPLIDIDDFSFDKSDQVQAIYLNNSEIVSIEARAFDELESLQELYLAGNFLNNLPETFVENNENLILLDLSSNQFADMPKIYSESLEILAFINSGLQRIPKDSLSAVINLRILFIQENNLKTIDPGIFDIMPNLYNVKLEHNPWQCTCKTIRLFQNLSEKNLTDLTESLQCQTQDKIFVELFNKRRLSEDFSKLCATYNQNIKVDEKFKPLQEEAIINSDEKTKILQQMPISDSEAQDREPEVIIKPTVNEEIELDYFTNFFYSVILSTAVALSLLAGALLGSLITYKWLSRNIRQTESIKTLLAKNNYNYA